VANAQQPKPVVKATKKKDASSSEDSSEDGKLVTKTKTATMVANAQQPKPVVQTKKKVAVSSEDSSDDDDELAATKTKVFSNNCFLINNNF
jgi:hypothetical protein